MKKYLAVLAALMVALLTACSADADSSSAAAEKHNAADVSFAQMMIPHHQQAIEMAEMIDGKQVSAELAQLAGQIKDAQQPEIDAMTSWLQDWNEPVTGAPADHGAHGGTSGMMSDEDMGALMAADGPAFEKMWLEMMIAHHQGAIEMAEAEVADGQFPDAVQMAEDIIAGQQDEVERMQKMLGT